MNYMTAMIQLPLVKEAPKDRVRTPEDVARVCDDLRGLAQETFHVLALDSKNNLMNRHMVTLGLVDASLVHPREVLRVAIVENASAIILTHNHPSGDPTPSAEDIRITRQLVEAGKIVDIKVLDHIIIGHCVNGFTVNCGDPNGRSFLSMREEGVCDFS